QSSWPNGKYSQGQQTNFNNNRNAAGKPNANIQNTSGKWQNNSSKPWQNQRQDLPLGNHGTPVAVHGKPIMEPECGTYNTAEQCDGEDDVPYTYCVNCGEEFESNNALYFVRTFINMCRCAGSKPHCTSYYLSVFAEQVTTGNEFQILGGMSQQKPALGTPRSPQSALTQDALSP
ncbi:hypothetical protein FQN57_004054, partial [Myotisia sp. PD_48]